MRSTDYATIERGVASIAGIEPDNILAHEKTILADYITDATKFCWDYHPWGECTITEKRYFKDIWTSALAYDIGHEVYHNGVFYRNHSGGNSNPSDLIHWYEIGDNIAETEWQEDGLYSIGARVGYNGKSYACKKVSQLGKANFSTDGIEVTNSEYFVEVDTFFERFIDYEQTGKNVIENCLGIYTSDPRYSNAKHLNFREGREGIYIEAIDGIINEFWVTYKIASPVFTSTETSGEIPRFLTQAIKAHAYQSFLIGEGQHEKAQLQELKILDLLVREVDKIDLQANKNKPYSIEHTSHRIINSRQGQTTASTPHLVNTLREGQSDLTFKIGTSVEGRTPFIKSTLDLYFCLKTEVEGQDILDPRRKYGTTTCHSNLRVPAITSRAIKTRSVNRISSSLSVAGVSGFDAGQSSSVDPISITISVAPPYGNFVYANEADLSFGLNVAGVSGNTLFANRVEVDLGLDVSFDFTSPAIRVAMQDANSNSWLKWDDTQTYIGTSTQNRMSVNFTNAESHLEVGTYKLRYKLLSDTTAFNNSQNGVVHTSPSGHVSDPFLLGGGSQRFSRIDPTREYQIWLLDENNLSLGIDATINGQAPLYTNTLTNNGTESTIFTKSTGSIPYLSLVHHQHYRTQANTGVPQQPFNLPYDPVPYGAYYWRGHSEGSVWNFTPTQDQVTELTIQINTTQNNSRVVVVFAQDRGQNNDNINIFETESIQIIKI